MTDIKIAVATHKLYQMPKESMYIPIQSGAELNPVGLGYVKDNTGDNISKKNLNYSELTALYWLWKNNDAEYKGLVHYRRHFSNKNSSLFSTGKFENILNYETLLALLKSKDIIVPNKRNYYIETIGNHYNHTHYSKDLVVTREVINDLFPAYLESYEKVLQSKSAHMFNMFIMKKNYFNDYCDWMFTILFEIENRLDISEYSAFHQRVFGRISEILLDVWLIQNKLDYCEIPVMFMEKQSWTIKIFRFLKAKFGKIRYR